MQTATYDRTKNDVYRAMLGVEKELAKCTIERSLRELIKLHVSQINGCAFCIDMHWKDARAYGEDEQRLYSLSAWRECPYYSERERAGLLMAETLTRLAHQPVLEEVHEQAREHFNEEELNDLAWTIAAINAWNRLSIAVKATAGEYQPPRR